MYGRPIRKHLQRCFGQYSLIQTIWVSLSRLDHHRSKVTLLIQIRRWVDDAKHKRPHSTLDVQVDASRLIWVDSQVYL